MRRRHSNMNFILLIVYISLLHVPVHATSAFLVPKTINTQAGASYVLMIKHETAVPTECYTENGTQKYFIDLFHSGIAASPLPDENYAIQPGADGSDVVTSLGNGICGFKVDSVSPSPMRRWNLSFVDQSRNSHFAIANVFVSPRSPRHVVEYERIGNSLYIGCPSGTDGVDDVSYIIKCRLYNPQNQLVKSEAQLCRLTLKQSKVSDFGVWKCLLTYKTHMLPTEITFEFIPKGKRRQKDFKTWLQLKKTIELKVENSDSAKLIDNQKLRIRDK